jgi:hypothetical protein
MRFGGGVMKEISMVMVWSSQWQEVAGEVRVVPIPWLLR